MATPTHQLTLVADERHYDLVVPVGTRVTDVLSVLGISSSASPSSVATAGGHVYGPQDRLDDDLPAGAVLTVVRTTTHRVHRDVVSLDRTSSAPGARTAAPAAPAWAGGGRRTASDPGAGAALVDDSTRRREELDPDATVSRAALRSVPRGTPTPGAGRRALRVPDLVVPALGVGLGLLCVVTAALGLLATPAGTTPRPPPGCSRRDPPAGWRRSRSSRGPSSSRSGCRASAPGPRPCASPRRRPWPSRPG